MGGVFPFFGHFGDTATLAPTQRMLRKGAPFRSIRCVGASVAVSPKWPKKGKTPPIPSRLPMSPKTKMSGPN